MVGDALLLLGALALTWWVATRPLPSAVTYSVAAWLIVPAPLVVPNPLTSGLTADRLILAGLFAAWLRHRSLSRGSTSARLPDVLGSGAGAPIIALSVMVAYIIAFTAAGPAAGGTAVWGLEILTWADRLATLTLVVLVAQDLDAQADAAGTRPSAPWLRGITVGLLTISFIAAIEWVTGRAFGQALFSPLGSLQGLDAAAPLEMRAGAIRVRAGAEFALELGWIVVALAPAALATAIDDQDPRWQRAGAVALAASPVVVYLTRSRSALAALPIAAMIWLVFARQEPSTRWSITAASILGIGLIGLVGVAAPGLTAVEIDRGSIEVREERLEVLTTAAAERPVVGLGVGAVDQLGVGTTDSSYLQLYAEVGVLGLGVLLIAVFAGIGAMAPILMHDGPERSAAVAALTGAAALVGGSAAYDALTVRMSARLLWILIGVGIVTAARCGVTTRIRRPGKLRVVAAAGLVFVGVALGYLAPSVASVEHRFTTVPPQIELGAGDPVQPFGRTYTTDLCASVASVAISAGLDWRCRDEGLGAWGRQVPAG